MKLSKKDLVGIILYWAIGATIPIYCLVSAYIEYRTFNLGLLYLIPAIYILLGIGLTQRIIKESKNA